MAPMADTSATQEPVTPPKNMQETTSTRASPPLSRPTRALASTTMRSEIPPTLMISPARMNSGMVSSDMDWIPVFICWARTAIGSCM